MLTEYLRENDRIFIYILMPAILLSRLPLIIHGFGAHSDTWRMGITAHNLFYYREYFPSRSTGYPIPEFLYSIAIPFGPLGTNLLSLTAGIISILIFYNILDYYDSSRKRLLVVTFSFLPLIWITSTTTIDYLYALAFILLTWYLLLRNRELLAGVAFGAAIASRPQLAATGLAILYLSYQRNNSWNRTFQMFVISGIVATIAYIPLLLTVGIYDMVGASGESSAGNAIIQTLRWGHLQWARNVGFYLSKWFGLVQVIIISLLSATLLLDRIINKNINYRIVFSFLWIIPHVVFFLLFPNKGPYLIPILPVMLFLINELLTSDRIVAAICILLVLNNFVTPGLGIIIGEPQGAVERNYNNRIVKSNQANVVADYVLSDNNNNSTIIVAGGFAAPIQYELLTRCGRTGPCNQISVGTISKERLREAENVYYTWQGQYQTPYNISKYGTEINLPGAYTFQYANSTAPA